MKLNLTELSRAVAAVAGMAAEHAAMKTDIVEAQATIDTLTASLSGVMISPAGAAGLVAVADALSPPPLPEFLQAPADPLANLK